MAASLVTPVEPNTLSGILDIETPTAPFATSEVWLITVVVLLALACLIYLLRRRHASPCAQARRRLAALQHHIDQRQIDGRRAAFELAAILRDAFGVRHLSSRAPSFQGNAPQESGWHELITKLTTARYAAPELSPAQLGELMAAARHWLQHQP